MSISQTIIAGVCLTIIISVLAYGMSLMIPMFGKLQFDHICRNYFLLSEINNGLTDEYVSELEDKLIRMGLSDIMIEVPSPFSIKRGEALKLRVEGTKTSYSINALFLPQKRDTRLIFDREFVVRRVLN